MLQILVDADACTVKHEIYRVAARYHLSVTLVANSWMRVPADEAITLEVVGSRLDAADDWIAKRAKADDIIVTADIRLASRCVKEGARVLGPTGKPFTEDNVGEALATRDLLADIRSRGERTGGPPPLEKRDRSRFLQELDEMILSVLREHRLASR